MIFPVSRSYSFVAWNVWDIDYIYRLLNTTKTNRKLPDPGKHLRLLTFSLIIICCRSAAKTKLTADGLVTKLGECSSKWSKSALQVMHQLWTEHGSLVQTHQELQAVASIGQVRLYFTHFMIPYIRRLKLKNLGPHKHFVSPWSTMNYCY